MTAAEPWKKILVFGLLGALGCLAGWLLGEGFLLATLPSREAGSSPSLAQKPEPPPALQPLQTVNPPPALPVIKEPPPPPPPPKDFEERLKEKNAKTGDLQISLLWYNYNDLDLHCIDPQGKKVYFSNKKVPSGGELDVDMNAGGQTSTRPVENIYWPQGGAPLGRYQVFVNHYAKHNASDPTSYKVNVLVENVRKEFAGAISQGATHPIYDFELKPGLRVGVPTELVVLQDGRNTLPVKIARERFNEPVTIRFEGDLDRVVIRDIHIPAGETTGKTEVVVDRNAVPGKRSLRATALGGTASSQIDWALTVKPLPLAIRLSAPPKVSVNPGGVNQLKVLVARDFFEGPVTLRFEGDLQQLTVPEVTIPADKTEAEIELKASADSKDGVRGLRVKATGGGVSAESPLEVTVLKPDSAARPEWSWLMVLLIGCWTALLAAGLSLALVMAQNHHLGRPLLTGRDAVVFLGGGLAAGLVAGMVGQALFGMLAGANLMPQLGFLAGWVLLGALVGRGLAFIIPNLNALRATGAGALGGLFGAVAFLVVSALGNVAGRFMGAAILGFAIGLMVVMVEMLYRKAWLKITYGPREVGMVSLGDSPVLIGSDSRACTIYSRDTAPIACRYLFRAGQVICEDVVKGGSQRVPVGHSQRVGSVEILVCGASDRGAEATPPAPIAPRAAPAAPAPLPTPVAPPQATRPAQPAAGQTPAANACPRCGRVTPGAPGQRFCMICERAF